MMHIEHVRNMILIIILPVWMICAVKASMKLRSDYRPEQKVIDSDRDINVDKDIASIHRSLSNNGTFTMSSTFSENSGNGQIKCFGSMFEMHNVRKDGLGVTLYSIGVHTSSKYICISAMQHYPMCIRFILMILTMIFLF